MQMHTLGILVYATTCCLGCTNTSSSSKTAVLAEASTIQYTLPDTRALIDVTLTLETCDFTPKARAIVSVTPYAVQSAPTDKLSFELRGSELESFWKKRDIKIALHPHGALKTINAGSQDATAGIIGGFIKLAAGAAGADGTPEPTECNDATNVALEKYRDLTLAVRALRNEIELASDADAVAKQIVALTQEIARLETSELQIKLSTRIGFEKRARVNDDGDIVGVVTGGLIQWKRSDFDKWTLPHRNPGSRRAEPDGKVDAFSFAYCVRETTASGSNSCTTEEAAAFAKLDEVSIGTVACVNDNSRCPKTMVFRDPVSARIVVVAAGNNFTNRGVAVPESTKIGGGDLSLAQWGELSYLDLSVGFGGARSIALALDGYGRKTQFGWTSNARGEGIVNGLNTINDAYSSARSAADGEGLQSMKDRVTRLETQQKLNKLENCAAILDNGGFVCPVE